MSDAGDFRLLVASCFAVAAAARLLMWRWHVRTDTDWLNKTFGESENNASVANAHSMCVAALVALVALGALYG